MEDGGGLGLVHDAIQGVGEGQKGAYDGKQGIVVGSVAGRDGRFEGLDLLGESLDSFETGFRGSLSGHGGSALFAKVLRDGLQTGGDLGELFVGVSHAPRGSRLRLAAATAGLSKNTLAGKEFTTARNSSRARA